MHGMPIWCLEITSMEINRETGEQTYDFISSKIFQTHSKHEKVENMKQIV
jgi:hypothetical protein